LIPVLQCARCNEWFIYEDTICEDCGLDLSPCIKVAKSENPSVSNYINRARWFWNAGIGLGFDYNHPLSEKFLNLAYAKSNEDLLSIHDFCYGSCYLYAKNKDDASISGECTRAAHMSAGLHFIRNATDISREPLEIEIQGVQLLNQHGFYIPENILFKTIVTNKVRSIN